jgi:catechol 2,3-dioxygenase-like lactoylglutathione lyase family enzyme
MIQKIDHINIVVSDLDEAKAFFLILGFQEVISSRLSGEQLSIVTGLKDIEAEFVGLSIPGTNTNVELIQYFFPVGDKDPKLSLPNQIGFRHMAFAVDDIEAEVNRLRSKGIEFESDIQVWERTGKKLVYFYGPDGILFEFAQYPES